MAATPPARLDHPFALNLAHLVAESCIKRPLKPVHRHLAQHSATREVVAEPSSREAFVNS
jgi:hypothetical protein